MDSNNGRMMGWRFSIVEMVGFGFSVGAVTVAITLWSVSTFQTKVDAVAVKQDFDRQVESLKVEVATLRAGIDAVAKDVSYIRGRLEPKN